ncbi:hypothetical protein [Ensifer sp. B1-9]|uniref:hypothetical protein n=1 Tax=Ensifer sp. B1-9 TaxID=3141455 RepID=UPI003D224909
MAIGAVEAVEAVDADASTQGESGSGKATLICSTLHLETPISGTIGGQGQDLGKPSDAELRRQYR